MHSLEMFKKISLVSLCTIVIFFELSDAQDYCNLQKCPAGQHTMCLYPSTDPSSNCGSVTSNGLSQEERDLILRLHNEDRKRVANGDEHRGLNGQGQPAAQEMPDLTWNNELETIAQRWALQCNFGHDGCRNIENDSVGQNVAMSWSQGGSPGSLEGLVQMWYDEVAEYDANSVDKFTSVQNGLGKDIGHYTQMVWAKTTSVGCGKVSYTKDGTNTLYLVCDYAPTGNFIGYPVYVRR